MCSKTMRARAKWERHAGYTTEATYNAEEGIVELPAHYAEDDLTVAWYVPIDQKQHRASRKREDRKIDRWCCFREDPRAGFQRRHSYDQPQSSFDDEEKASHVETIRVTQGGSELSQYVYQNGSIC